MSSPFPGPYNGHPSRSAASSPRLAPRPQPPEDASIRPMKLKVLYTFDHENKTNCLARWPQNIDIRTAYLDETTQIGVIELKTCIQAIVAASPELVAKLGQDYTVYAYDYSEYDTPQVGQGMLSWVLASSSSTPSAPAHQSKTIVTGRVCKNIMGLFSDSAQETLEVKLRLVPVPSCLQSEYIESMKSYRDLSRVMPEGFDSQAWTNFLQMNPGITQLLAQSRSDSPALASGQQNTVGIENVQRLMNQGRTSPERLDHVDQNPLSQSDSYSAAEAIEHLPRPSSQASNVRSTAPPKKARGRPPKAWNELSDRERKKRRARSRHESSDVGYGSNDDLREDAPHKKRAKVTRADYPGASSFGKQPELRVAASAAASLRVHQPTAIRPSNPTASALEGPPREPTPVARLSNTGARPLLPAITSNLRCESLLPKVTTRYESPYQPLDTGKRGDSEKGSPEGSRADSANSPADFASSPPAYPGSAAAPSSPRLPTLPLDMDSGFMSGAIDDLFEDDEYRPLEDEDMDVAARYLKRSDLHVSESTGRVTSHDSGFESSGNNTQSQKNAVLQEQGNSHCSDSTPRVPNCAMLCRTGSSGDLPQLSASTSSGTRPSLLHRSQTWAGHQEEHPSPDVIPTSEAGGPVPTTRSRNRTGSGSGMKRKQAIQSKLAETVAKGEMPPFCENCGAIETPTWRKAWMRVHSGTPEHVILSDEDGGIVAWQALQTDTNGHVCLFRIIKRNLLPEDEGFTESLLCNPCGIWLHTRKCMRPKEVWDKTQGPDGGSGGPRRRASQTKKGKSDSLPYQSASEDASGGSTFISDGSSPADADGGASEHHASQLPTATRPRASSVQAERSNSNWTKLNESSAAAALQRAIQSSPVRCRGGQQLSGLGKDLTPRPTRRVLFPSPTPRGQSQSSLVEVSDGKGFAGALRRHKGDEFDSADKENLPPHEDDEERPIFDEIPQRSVTPTPRAKAGDMAFKTPDRSSTSERMVPTTGDFFSSAVKALLRPEITPERGGSRSNAPRPLSEISPFAAQVNSLLSDANMHSPPGSQFGFPSLPSLASSPHRVRQDFDFSHFDPQDLLSTDVPMASSPPVEGWFGVYEDPTDGDGTFWNEYPFPGSSPPATGSESSSAKKENTPRALCVDDSGRARVDFAALAGGNG